MKKYFLFACVAAALVSCSSDEFLGENPELTQKTENDGAILFKAYNGKAQRATVGDAAAEILGKAFVVEGLKGADQENAPGKDLVFDNYLVKFTNSSAGTTESNTNNWEYVGITDAVITNATSGINRTVSEQTIKYWDFTAPKYDFVAYSVGNNTMTVSDSPSANQVKVTKIDKANLGTSAYTFKGTVDDLSECYVTDIQSVANSEYKNPVTLKFKNLTAKIRLGFYETIPGYSVSNLEFYPDVASTKLNADLSGNLNALLLTNGTDKLPSGTATTVVKYPYMGTQGHADYPAAYNKAQVQVTASSSTEISRSFGTVNYTSGKLGTDLNHASMAGKSADSYFTPVFPSTTGMNLTLRCNYTLTSIDGSGETIKVYGAKAVVPATYTVWQPNFAYTYIFKISDNTNGWTAAADAVSGSTDKEGLFPITFDAVVTDINEDLAAEQTTITTVAAPSITTYQQGHDYTAENEYSKTGGKDIYVQVMKNGSLVTTLNEVVPGTSDVQRASLYLVEDGMAEADVMDVLQKQVSKTSGTIKGRNNKSITVNSNINNEVESIVNGIDNKAITVTKGEASKLIISALTAGKTYAFVYDYSSAAKTSVNQYYPVVVTVGASVADGLYILPTASITELESTTNAKASADYVYFFKSADNKFSYTTTIADVTPVYGLYKVAKTAFTSLTKTSSTTAAEGNFYFDVYTENNGDYAVKIIKVVE